LIENSSDVPFSELEEPERLAEDDRPLIGVKRRPDQVEPR
jgi:hypothetical protein